MWYQYNGKRIINFPTETEATFNYFLRFRELKKRVCKIPSFQNDMVKSVTILNIHFLLLKTTGNPLNISYDIFAVYI